MDVFLSLGAILVLGFIGGYLLDKIHLPKLIWYLILGILLGPSLLNVISPTLLGVSSYLRQIALVIILTRSGLSLDIKKLKEVGRPAILMCFVPACFEMAGIAIFAPMFFGISIYEALLLGSVLAAVSPAVVVPRMIKLQEDGLGNKHHVPELVMAGSSVDDIFVIVLFYAFKGLVANNTFDAWGIAQIPISIVSGITFGGAIGMLLVLVYKKVKMPSILRVVIFFGVSLAMLGFENFMKQYFSISSLLGIIVAGILVGQFCKAEAPDMRKSYNGMWNFFEILLFALVGCATNAKYAFSTTGAVILGMIAIALVFRSIGVIVCVSFTKFNWKERLFIIISYLPKATVQASIGGIALSEGLACGELVLTAAVVAILFTAPLGAILMDTLRKPLLKEAPPKIDQA